MQGRQQRQGRAASAEPDADAEAVAALAEDLPNSSDRHPLHKERTPILPMEQHGNGAWKVMWAVDDETAISSRKHRDGTCLDDAVRIASFLRVRYPQPPASHSGPCFRRALSLRQAYKAGD